jgi:FkbM family methyltransferase
MIGKGIPVTIADGTQVVVPATLRSMTAYVAIEQEDWFEKEIGFIRRWLRPGMRAIDIGAGHGLYSLTMARLVGRTGGVWAFEPASVAAAMLRQSVALNDFSHHATIAAALSDAPGRAWLGFAGSGELNALGADPHAAGEDVAVTTLDAEDERQRWGSPDFVKIDAEGQEAKIVAGGARFFARHAPLVMFEVKANTVVDLAAAHALRAMGYDIYRLVPGGPMLVPHAPDAPLDGYELNLFAARRTRAASLAAAGLLVRPGEEERLPASRDGLALLHAQPFAAAFAQWRNAAPSRDYREALDRYAAWRDATLPPAARYASLRQAVALLSGPCAAAPGLATLSSLARAATEAGERRRAVAAGRQFLSDVRANRELDEPLWPAWPGFDAIVPGAPAIEWAVAAAATGFEQLHAFSTYFVPPTEALEWLCASRFATAAMIRRRVLPRARAARNWTLHALLARPAPDHRNAALWRTRLAAFR